MNRRARVPSAACTAAVGLVLGLAWGPARAEETGAQQAPVVKLTLHPAPEPRPALKYRLLPEAIDLKPGNAAVMYNKVFLQWSQRRHDTETWQRIVDWSAVPLDGLPRDAVRKTLSSFESEFDALGLAARRDHCDWQLPLTERNPLALLLPEVQEARQGARLLAAKARLEMAEGDFDGAVRTLQTGFSLARHVAEGPTLVTALVGMASCGMMCEQVETLVQQPGTPNLYWALTWLPRPYIDMRRAVEMEMHFLELALPELKDVETRRRSPAEWQALLDGLAEKMAASDEGPPAGWQARLAFTALAMKGYPMARDGLVGQGYSREEVEAMPVPQVVLLYTLRTYAHYRDEMFKWFAVPYAEAATGIERAERTLATEARRREIVPLATLLLPALRSAQAASARTDRRIAVLRVIEALRMYAHSHEGRLPDRLDDVAEVPVPLDPLTGKPFQYRRVGDAVVLEAPAPAGLPAQGHWLRFEIRIAH